MFVVKPGDEVYEGQIVGEHCNRDTDIPVNVAKTRRP
jgi:predicted membrane GTPase involved in stress response